MNNVVNRHWLLGRNNNNIVQNPCSNLSDLQPSAYLIEDKTRHNSNDATTLLMMADSGSNVALVTKENSLHNVFLHNGNVHLTGDWQHRLQHMVNYTQYFVFKLGSIKIRIKRAYALLLLFHHWSWHIPS